MGPYARELVLALERETPSGFGSLYWCSHHSHLEGTENFTV